MPEKALRQLLAIAAFALCASIAHAEQATPPPVWLQKDVYAAWEKIELDTAQVPAFRAAVGTFLDGFNSDARRILRKGRGDMQRAIARKRRGRVKDMDADMAALLTETQYPRYETYRDLLLTKMDERARAARRRR